tara:strand:+ start:1474 stop:1887 length:414 start_codon:yes stop_codon:yes gene_type:complete
MKGLYAKLAASTALVSGMIFNAATRIFDNKFDLADEGGTADAILIAKVREGNKLQTVTLQSDANLSAISFTIGTLADPDAFGAAQAGPAANAKKELVLNIATAGGEPFNKPTDIYLKPSAAVPSAGTLITKTTTSKR